MNRKIHIPEIRINFSWLLKDDISKKVAKLNGWKLDPDEQYEEWAQNYRDVWSEKEKQILIAMQEITGLDFYLSVIDITVAPYIIPKSQPLIISFMDTPETVIDTIMHELSHTLLCDNKIISIYGNNRNFKLANYWAKQFPEMRNDFNALVHVPVHAICQNVFEHYLNDKDFVQRDRKLNEKFNATSYLKSWDYVERVGAKVIIEKLKKSYSEIAQKLEKKL